MTSKRAADCFVYITLPGEVSATTAGRFVLGATRKGDPFGRFVYGRSYLENPKAVAIDPVELKLTGATYETVQLNGVFGALREMKYDGWLTIESFGFALGELSAAASIWRDLATNPEDIAFEGVKFLKASA